MPPYTAAPSKPLLNSAAPSFDIAEERVSWAERSIEVPLSRDGVAGPGDEGEEQDAGDGRAHVLHDTRPAPAFHGTCARAACLSLDGSR